MLMIALLMTNGNVHDTCINTQMHTSDVCMCVCVPVRKPEWTSILKVQQNIHHSNLSHNSDERGLDSE